MNVLLAEDDAVTRLTLGAALKGMGHDVTEAEHGGEAWADLELAHFPIVISDWQMPELDGPELCRRIRARADARYTYFLLIERILGLRRHVQQLEGLLPICAYCKRIRHGDQNWESIERYVEARSEAQFSHVRPQIERA